MIRIILKLLQFLAVDGNEREDKVEKDIFPDFGENDGCRIEEYFGDGDEIEDKILAIVLFNSLLVGGNDHQVLDEFVQVV